jgi:leucyl-tRNA synthetase
MAYDPKAIEAKWQARWREQQVFRAELDPSRPKFYVLDMFPYPSGSGLHVGHPKGYIATDVLSRYKRMCGFNVLHPMGWDAFGLPAEQYAIETGTHPRDTTRRNVARFKNQLQALGLDYDWSREIDTTDPGYFRWTQWIFGKLYERDLAYLAEVPVNWCPALGTVLANEEVIDGKSERGGHPVVRVPMRQWMLRITAYADRLVDDLDQVDWPEAIKKMQRDWIGRSHGARVFFELADGSGERIEVFTTRPDTLFGATYLVLAPEHPLVARITTDRERRAVEDYVQQTARRSERSRLADAREKSGVFTGAMARHPATGDDVPIWIADYVLASYGTGAIMAVPAHDTRDHECARRFGLPIVEGVKGGRDVQEEAFVGEGVNVHSGFLGGLPTAEAQRRMCEWLEAQGRGAATVSYKLRDWLFSRQRYWGEPFPVLHLEDGSTRLVPESQLPVELPELDDFRPSGEFEPPLARVRSWVEVRDPETGARARRDANTMPQWAGSCWYYLRFCDPHNEREPWSAEAERYWMPVDLYVGGAEHAVLHLLYARFWHKVLYDLGLVHTVEPFQKLLNPGMILGFSYRYYDDDLQDAGGNDVHAYPASQVEILEETPRHRDSGAELKARWVPGPEVRWSDRVPYHPEIDGLELEVVTEKMSKSRGNVVNPDDVIARWGTDALRLYEMFMGPLEKGAPWSDESIPGVSRFLHKAYQLFVMEAAGGEERPAPLVDGEGTEEQAVLLARTLQGVTDDLEGMRFNTAISKLMVFVNEIAAGAPPPRAAAECFARMLAPFAPHLAEEIWEHLGHAGSLARGPWPVADPARLVSDTVRLVVQVNGKKRDEIEVAADADGPSIEAAALACDKVQKHLAGRAPRKVIVVPGRLVNVVG